MRIAQATLIAGFLATCLVLVLAVNGVSTPTLGTLGLIGFVAMAISAQKVWE